MQEDLQSKSDCFKVPKIKKIGCSTLMQEDLRSESDCFKVPKSKNRMQYFGEGRWAKRTFLQQSTKPNISVIWISCHLDKDEYPSHGFAMGKRSLSYILTKGRWEHLCVTLTNWWMTNLQSWNSSAQREVGHSVLARCHVMCNMASACSASHFFAFTHYLTQIYSCGEPLSDYLAWIKL